MALTSKKNNRSCIVCGRSYYFCNHCQDGEIKPSWFNIFHNQNCHDIYDAVANIYPEKGKEAAKETLDKLDLSNKENFHPNIIKLINEIYDIKNVENIEDNNVENIVENTTDEKINIEIKEEKEEEKKQVIDKTEAQSEVEEGKEAVNVNIKPNSSATVAKKVSRNIKNKK